MKRPKNAIVIGAGVVGISTAYALARWGISVEVIDAGAEAGTGASYANGAQLSYCYTDALASPAIWPSLPHLMLGRDQAFRMKMKLDFEYGQWLCSFLRNCTKSRFQSNTLAALTLAQESCSAMVTLQKLHAIDFGYSVSGKMHLFHDRAKYEKSQQIAALKSRSNSSQLMLSPSEATAIEPSLEMIADQIAGVIYSPNDAVGDAHLFCKNMTELLRNHYDVRFSFNTRISALDCAGDNTAIATADGEFLHTDLAVVCTGSVAAELLKPMGQQLPIQPMKGYSFEIPASENSPRVSITDTTRRVVFANLGDKIRIAGLADMGDGSDHVDPVRMENLVRAASASLPHAGCYDKVSNKWAGLRPMTPDSRPIISRPYSNLAINVGHGMLGWTMAMGAGERVAALL